MTPDSIRRPMEHVHSAMPTVENVLELQRKNVPLTHVFMMTL